MPRFSNRFIQKISAILLVATTLASPAAWSISSEMQDLVQLETESNAAAYRSRLPIEIKHLDIPLFLVTKNIAARTSPLILNSLIFNKNNELYFRWIVNPEDTKYYKSVQKFLASMGLSTELQSYYTGYQTASRSYVIVDPATGAEFSAKGSTDGTGGLWKDKKQTLEDAKQIRIIADYVDQAVKKGAPLEHLILLDEPAVFGLEELDQAIVIRDYKPLIGTRHRFVPGFSIMHSQKGRELAELNGSSDPASYWNEHYNKPLARAFAEFNSLTGLTYDSPHSQNFLVELDASNRPTGKIALRDYGDSRLSADFLTSAGREDIVSLWPPNSVKRGELYVLVGILHGNHDPDWIGAKANGEADIYKKWGRDFFDEYRKEFHRQTGLSLTPTTSDPLESFKYFGMYYNLKDRSGKQFLNLVRKGQQRLNGLHLRCEALFTKL